MKCLVSFLLLASCLPAQYITNVRVMDVTSQQATLRYSAPLGEDTAQCALAVSTSPSLSPLVPAVDPSLFSGANLDSTASGRIRAFVVGQRIPSTGLDGNVYSLSMAAATTYYYQITCPSRDGPQSVTGSFTTATIPAGSGAGDPIPVDPHNPGSYLYPTISATDRTATTTDPHTGALVKNLVLPGDVQSRISTTGTAASGSTSISTGSSSWAQSELVSGSGIQAGTYVLGTSGSTITISKPTTQALSGTAITGGIIPTMGTTGGQPQFCNPTPVLASDENKYGYNCLIGINGLGLYWMASDGETRFLGMAYTNSYPANKWQGAWANGGGQGYMLTVTGDPNTFYFPVIGSNASAPWSSSERYLVKGEYNGHTQGCIYNGKPCDVDQTGIASNITLSPQFSFTTITPSDNSTNLDRSVQTLMSEFDPNWSTYLACCSTLISDTLDSMVLFRGYAQQDNPGWVAMFDPTATAVSQTARYGSAAGCVDNPAVTGSNYTGQAGCIVASMGTFTGSGGSPFRWGTLHSAMGGVAFGSGWERVGSNTLKMEGVPPYQVTLSSNLPGSYAQCTMPKPAGSYITNWPDASWSAGCASVTVTGDPTLSGTFTGLPSSIPAAPGDLVSFNSASTGSYELARLLDKGSDGKTWYIQRQYSPLGAATYTAVSSGGTLDMVPPNWGFGVGWWNYAAANQRGVTDYTNSNVGDPLGSGHAAYQNASNGRWSISDSEGVTWQVMWAQPGYEPGRLTNTTQYPITAQQLPGFNSVACVANSSTPCSVESHPSLSVLNPPSSTVYEVNNYPYMGDYEGVQASDVSLVSGQLYKIHGLNVLNNYKLIAYFANSGNFAMREVSGPSATLATDSSTAYEWCFAYHAGECYSGSAAGDAYFNAPNVTNTYCTNNWSPLETSISVPNDICISPAWSWTQGIVAQPLVNDPTGATARVISNSFSRYETELNFWNTRFTPDGSWMFTELASDGLIKLIKVPPMAYDDINRRAYVPVTVQIPPQGTGNSVAVQFGYAEEPGGSGALDCTARQESCVAVGSTISQATPFYFSSESYTPMPCANGCSVAIPGVSGRTLQWDYVVSGNKSYTSPVMTARVF